MCRQIDRYCEFLEAEGIMDYSLLVGVHFREDVSTSKMMGLSSRVASSKFSGNRVSFQTGGGMSEFRLSSGWQDMDRIIDNRKPLIRLGSNMPARAEHVSSRSEPEVEGSNKQGFPKLQSNIGIA